MKNNIKNKLITFGIVATTLFTSGCSSTTTDRFDFNVDDIAYDIDPETGLCFGATGVRNKRSADVNGLGMTCVPCTEEVLKQVNSEHLKETKENGIKPIGQSAYTP